MVKPNELLLFVHEYLAHSTPSLDLSEIKEDTDLIAFGIESIQLLQMIVKIEKHFGVSLSLDKLTKNDFKFSINTLLGYID